MTQQARGANARLIIQEETAFNTDPALPAAYALPIISCGLRASRPTEQSEVLRSDRNPTRGARLNTDVAGPLVTELQAYIALLFKGVLGSVATVGAAAPYTHTFKVGPNLPSFLVEKGFTDVAQYFKYGGVKFGKLAFDVTPAGFQKITFDMMGAQETVSAASFDAAATSLGKVSFDGFAISTVEEGGVAIADVASITGLTFDNDLDGDSYNLGGAGVRGDIAEGLVKVSGTLNLRFKDVALYNKAIADTTSSLRIVYALGDGLGTAGNESLEILIPELIFSPNSPIVSGPKGVMAELPFTAFYEAGAGASALQVILKNTQATI